MNLHGEIYCLQRGLDWLTDTARIFIIIFVSA